MPVFTKGEKSVLFVHVPKTGGTSIEQLFLSAGWSRRHFLSKRANAADRQHYELLRCPPQHMAADQLQQMFRIERFDAIFMLSRDPISRLRSEYAMRRMDMADSEPSKSDVDKWADRQFKQYLGNKYILDNHMRPQVDFLVPGSRVYKLEDGLESAIADLNDLYGMDLPLNVEHAMDSRSLTGGKSSSSVEISESLERKIRAMYKDDFTAFHY